MTTEPSHYCTTCAHSREADGSVYVGGDRAFCAHGFLTGDGSAPGPCEQQRFDPTGACGTPGKLWELRA